MKSKKTIVLFLIFVFLAVLILMGSVLFSVKNVEGYCYNSDDQSVRLQVSSEEIHGIALGSNIFMVNEDKIKDKVENAIPNVKVVNIERKFPSSIYINYVVIEEYFRIDVDDGYLYISNEGKVLRKANKQESNPDNESKEHIKLIGGENFNSLDVGDMAFAESNEKFLIINEMMLAISRLGFHKEIVEIIDTVDLRFLSSNLLYLKTRPGVELEIQHPSLKLTEKVQYALSKVDVMSDAERKLGTVIVYNQGNKLVGSYSYDSRYTQKLEDLLNN